MLFTAKRTILFMVLLLTVHYSPMMYADAKVIAGWVERVKIEGQAYEVKAKLDTGAKTSSIYATNIEPYTKKGKRRVRFTLHLKDHRGKMHTLDMDKPRKRRVKIKNHDGVHDRRVVVELDIRFDGKTYAAEFSLADRREYIYSVLIGRDFLKGHAVVDASDTFLTKP